jgi:hypothetical protein
LREPKKVIGRVKSNGNHMRDIGWNKGGSSNRVGGGGHFGSTIRC